jgi:hypothetical protein
MSSGTIQVPPDSTGKKLDTSELTVGANLVERQNIVIADPVAAANVAHVTSGGALQVDATATTQPISVAELPLPTGASQDGTDGTGITPPVGGSGIRGWLSGIFNKLNTSVSVTGTFWQATQPVSGSVSVSNLPSTQAISAASLPLPTGAATAANQATQTTALAAIENALAGTLSVSGSVAVSNFPTTQPVSAASLPLPAGAATASGVAAVVTALGSPLQAGGAVTASAGTNLNTSALALETGGNLATVAAAQGSGATGVTPPAGASGILGWLSGIYQAILGTLTVSGTVTVSSQDNTIIDTQTNVSSAGDGNNYLTTGYSALSFQFTGSFAGSIFVQGSNDGTNWFNVLTQSTTDGSATDVISGPGIYTASVATKYLQYNIIAITGAANILVIGKTAVQEDTKLLAQSFDSTTGVQINANLAGGVNKDANNGIILSDAPAPVTISGEIGSNLIIDTQGYNSVSITTEGLAASTYVSNDKVTWSIFYPSSVGMNVNFNGAIGAGTTYVLPCLARYIKLTLTAAGNATYYLRTQSSAVVNPIDIAMISGSSPVNAGVGGVQSVGGNIAVGTAQTANPLVTGGVDAGGLTRRLLTDTGGRIATSAPDQTGAIRATTLLAPALGIQNAPITPVQDLSLFEGSAGIEILSQILTELRINNYYLYNLPYLLSGGQSNPLQDEPAAMRNEPSALN